MNLIVRTLLTLLMALTLNASMVLASTAHVSGHNIHGAAADPCDHHGHGARQAGHADMPNVDDCPQKMCPSCTGLPLSAQATLEIPSHRPVARFTLSHWSPSWQSALFRPPIHI